MYLSDSLVKAGEIRVSVDGADDYKQVDGVYMNVNNPGEKWLKLQCSLATINLRLTKTQLRQLTQQLMEWDAKQPE